MITVWRSTNTLTNATIMSQQEDDQKTPAPKMSKPTFFVWLAIFAAGVYYFYNKLDYVGVASVATVGFSCFCGFRMGASRIAASLLGIAAAIAVAPKLGMSQEHHFTQWFGTSGLANRFLSIGVVGLMVSMIVTVIVILITGRTMKNRPRLSLSNCWLGFLIGGAEGVIGIALLLGGILIIEPFEKQRAEQRAATDLQGQTIGKTIEAIATKTRASQLGPLVDKYNPFTRIPQLNQIEKIQTTVQVLSDPKQITGLLHHPSINELKQRPEMKQAVDQLMSDPEIKKILQSGKALDRENAMTLLNHPAVLQLVDQPGFVEEANRIINDAVRVRNTSR